MVNLRFTCAAKLCFAAYADAKAFWIVQENQAIRVSMISVTDVCCGKVGT